jgi:hypothetical protein
MELLGPTQTSRGIQMLFPLVRIVLLAFSFCQNGRASGKFTHLGAVNSNWGKCNYPRRGTERGVVATSWVCL